MHYRDDVVNLYSIRKFKIIEKAFDALRDLK